MKTLCEQERIVTYSTKKLLEKNIPSNQLATIVSTDDHLVLWVLLLEATIMSILPILEILCRNALIITLLLILELQTNY